MAGLLTSKIVRVDETLCQLAEYRRGCDDPGDILRATESIDQWLDKRLDLIRGNTQGELAGTAPSTSPR